MSCIFRLPGCFCILRDACPLQTPCSRFKSQTNNTMQEPFLSLCQT